jgi:hypothetical protein
MFGVRKILLLYFFLTSFFSFAQSADTVFYMNGNIVATRVIDTLIGAVTFFDPKDSTKKVNVENEAIFAIRYGNGNYKYYYTQDTVNGNWFTRDEMWYYMQGERDARKNYRSPGAFVGGLLFGMAGGATGALYAPLLPGAFLGACELAKVKIKQEWVSGPYLMSQVTYLLGFQREAFSKRRITILKGGGIGLAVGFSAFALYLNKGRWIWQKN